MAFSFYVVFDVWNLTILSSIFPIAVAAITLVFSVTAMTVLLLGITQEPDRVRLGSRLAGAGRASDRPVFTTCSG